MIESVLDRVTEVQKQLSKFGYKSFDIHASTNILKAGVAGVARYSDNSITISSHYLREFEKETLYRTVAHEVCHLYVHKYYPRHKQHHGPEFRGLMRLLGLDGDTYHSMKLVNGSKARTRTKTRYIYSCASKSDIMLTPQQHNKMRSGVARFTYRGEQLTFTGTVKKF